MSIRVHKVIGFGVRNFEPTEEFVEKYNRFSEMTPASFLRWAGKHSDEILAFRPNDYVASVVFKVGLEDKFPKHTLMWQFFTWQQEFGIPKVFVATPPEVKDRWMRMDDDIDWLEETERHNQKNRVVRIKKDLYPYPKGKPPFMIGAILLYLGLESYWTKLEELLYVYWG